MTRDLPAAPRRRPDAAAAPDSDAETLARIARAIAAARAGPPEGGAAAQHEGDREREGLPLAEMARLAHELKTPLGAISAAAEIMKDERLGPMGSDRYRGYAADIHASASHALAVLARVLETSRAPQPRPVLNFAEIDLNALVARTVSSLGPLAAEAGVGLAGSLAEGLPHVVADAVSVRQILINLVTNALRATPKSGSVEVRTAYALDGPLSFAVVDTGPGLGAASPAGPAAAPPVLGAGLGLGLPLVRELAALNGAELTLDSAPGRGTTATIRFARDRVIPV
jgi:two-component system, cell cycle sensor histidine kinase PleC